MLVGEEVPTSEICTISGAGEALYWVDFFGDVKLLTGLETEFRTCTVAFEFCERELLVGEFELDSLLCFLFRRRFLFLVRDSLFVFVRTVGLFI
jgi:hypothetical protein